MKTFFSVILTGMFALGMTGMAMSQMAVSQENAPQPKEPNRAPGIHGARSIDQELESSDKGTGTYPEPAETDPAPA
jgi:hypothetical protein